MATEKIEVRNRWTDRVQFTAEVECSPDAPWRLKLGLAVLWAHKTGARLVGANLVGARLVGANLDGARLDGASLVGANLDGARLDGARLVGASLDRASLDRASLVGARLVGASLVGALVCGEKVTRLLAIATRLDGYTFYAFELGEGGVKINAGCRWFTPAEFRAHVAKSYPGTKKADETLSIIAHIERMIEVSAVAPVVEAADAP